MLTITSKTPLLMFPLFELSCCCHGFVPVSKLTATDPAIITPCFATENIIRGKNNKNHFRCTKHWVSDELFFLFLPLMMAEFQNETVVGCCHVRALALRHNGNGPIR